MAPITSFSTLESPLVEAANTLRSSLVELREDEVKRNEAKGEYAANGLQDAIRA